LVEKHAAAQRLDTNLVWAVMGRESSGNRYALSNKNARGLLQVIPPTAARMGVTSGGGLGRDNYKGKEAAQMFTLIGIILMLAPLVAPMLGSALQSLTGWRSIFAFLFVYASIVFALLFRFLPKHKSAEPLRLSHVKQIGSRYRQVFATLPALGFLFYQAASFSSMMAFLSESPFVYMKLYNLSSHQYAWVFGCNIVTMMLCNRLTAFGLRRDWHSRDLLKVGIALQGCANIALVASVLWRGLAGARRGLSLTE